MFPPAISLISITSLGCGVQSNTKVLQINFVIEKQPHHGFHVELITDVEHHEDFIANSTHDDLYACVDLVLDRGVRQLTDHKDRLRNRKHPEKD